MTSPVRDAQSPLFSFEAIPAASWFCQMCFRFTFARTHILGSRFGLGLPKFPNALPEFRGSDTCLAGLAFGCIVLYTMYIMLS